jgi:hypothetical protein
MRECEQYIKGTQTEGIWEQGAEENIWTERLEKAV